MSNSVLLEEKAIEETTSKLRKWAKNEWARQKAEVLVSKAAGWKTTKLAACELTQDAAQRRDCIAFGLGNAECHLQRPQHPALLPPFCLCQLSLCSHQHWSRPHFPQYTSSLKPFCMKAAVGGHCFGSCQRKRAYLHRALTVHVLLTQRGLHRGSYLLLGNHQTHAGKQKQEWLCLWTHPDHLEQKPTALLRLKPTTLICTMQNVPRASPQMPHYTVYIQPTGKHALPKTASTPHPSESLESSG